VKQLRQDEPACASENKKDFCENCKRNIDMWDVVENQQWGEFRMTKSLKTNPVSYKCDGYIKT